jgi:hypothetical protein
MPAQRLAMRQVYAVWRLKWDQGLSERKIAQSLGISRPAVAEYVRRAQAAGMSWTLLVKSTTRGTAVLQTTGEGQRDRGHFPGRTHSHGVEDWWPRLNSQRQS